jgi:N-acyl-L-homoserine lactone synthetase
MVFGDEFTSGVRYPEPICDDNGMMVCFTTDETCKVAAFRLRYDVFTEELGRVSLANAATKEYVDENDYGRSHLIIATHNTEVIGTLRLTLRAEASFWNDDEYQYSKLYQILGFEYPYEMAEIALADRAVVAKPHRGSAALRSMWSLLYRCCEMNRIKVLVGVIDAENRALVRFHQRQGWQVYRHEIPFRDITADFIVKTF